MVLPVKYEHLNRYLEAAPGLGVGESPGVLRRGSSTAANANRGLLATLAILSFTGKICTVRAYKEGAYINYSGQ